MNRFLQLHMLTNYPAANPNRDDAGRPKQTVMGGYTRQRISSQSLKRAWRTSDAFADALSGEIGWRTRELGIGVYRTLLESGMPEKKANDAATLIAGVFGKVKPRDKKTESEGKPYRGPTIEQLVHVSPAEREAVDTLATNLSETRELPTTEQLNLLRKGRTAADIALFGRMLAKNPDYNVEAACQVSHAVSVHAVTIEDDYFTAVDDLRSAKRDDEDAGAAHIGETGFATSLFYKYICIDRHQLVENLGGDEELAKRAIGALVEAAATVSPSGKQNAFGSRTRASYILAETGDQQPRSLVLSFLRPVRDVSSNGYHWEAARALERQRDAFDQAYGPCADQWVKMNAGIDGTSEPVGSLQEIINFARS
ncbi:MAG: type I-E CRISPR-associated protein Cas7/Cse4/CasC [Alkalispirochaeta sp.]